MCNCVECKQPLDAKWQDSLVPTRPGFWLLTCLTPDCRLRGFTFSDVDYPPPPEKLARYDARRMR